MKQTKMTTKQTTATAWKHRGWRVTGEGTGWKREEVRFNGGRSVEVVNHWSEHAAGGGEGVTWKKGGPTKACFRLDNKRHEITLPNGVRTWFVVRSDDGLLRKTGREGFEKMGCRVETFEDLVAWVTGDAVRNQLSAYAWLGETPRDAEVMDVWFHADSDFHGRVRNPRLEFGKMRVWGGWVPMCERNSGVVRKSETLYVTKDFRGEARADLAPHVRAYRDLRVALNEEIPAAVFHPDRVERMEALYGEDWEVNCEVTGYGTKVNCDEEWEAKRAEERKKRDDARRMRQLMWD